MACRQRARPSPAAARGHASGLPGSFRSPRPAAGRLVRPEKPPRREGRRSGARWGYRAIGSPGKATATGGAALGRSLGVPGDWSPGKATATGGTALASAHWGCRAVDSLPGLVRKGGLEPPRLAALVPKTRASTNSATFAKLTHRKADGNGGP